ncbi:TRAP transporter substrate-binding protein [Cellulosilyticum sp. I15G10I2]|uniref:TRAP transporter substrate-binding protein n=1 Tax=Cellulosilyticum sp. I15G10I2 TaxID=1892843 RepID=UPI00085C6AD8|nr:TRAP transporter substrate-binding protein [Cellulosilyticum sp. I15G10I2]
MKKRILALLTTAALASTILTGCMGSEVTTTETQQKTVPQVAAPSKPTGDKIVIKAATGLTATHPAAIGLYEFEKLVEEKYPDRFDVQVYTDAQLGDDVSATQDVAMGNLELVVTSASPLVGMCPALKVFDLPFIVPNEAAADAIYDGEIGKKLADDLLPNGLRLLTYYENGFRNITNSKRDVRTPGDLSGLKIRTMENDIHLATFKALGAVPTPMAFSEVFTSLEQGAIDGQENPVSTIYLSKFYEVNPHVTLTGHVYGPHIVLMSEQFYQNLSAEEQAFIMEAAHQSALVNRSENRQMCTDYIQNLKDEGATVVELTAEEKQAFVDAVQPVYKEFVPQIGEEFVKQFQAVGDKFK